MLTCTRKLWFSAGHRVYQHESACANVHGHNYELHITAFAHSLDKVGRVIDFKVLKQKIDPWVQSNWDHGMLFWKRDVELLTIWQTEQLNQHKHFVCDFNPTAEEMASFLLSKCNNLLIGTGVTVRHIRLFETPNCWADAGEG